MSVEIQPADSFALYTVAHALHVGGKLVEAAAQYVDSLKLAPMEPQVLRDYGSCLAQQDKWYEAEKQYKLSLALSEQDANTHHDYAITLGNLGKHDDQLYHYDRALEIAPNTPKFRWNRAIALLGRGDYEEGWREYQWGVIGMGRGLRTLQPEWHGGRIESGTIFVWCEQGFGDTIQFVRFIKPLREYVGPHVKIILEVQPELVGLFADFPGVDQVVALDGSGAISFPCFHHVSLMSLPRVLDINEPQWFGEYVTARAKELPSWTKDMLKVGECFRGNPAHPNDKNRSLSYMQVINLLHGVNGSQGLPLWKESNDPEHVSKSPCKTFEDVAAYIAASDLVVTVDTAAAHLAGAMGKETWLLLPFAADWRWGNTGETTAWYPSMKLYRQDTPGDWSAVLTRVGADLQKRVEAHKHVRTV
jgi:hypothetical protein